MGSQDQQANLATSIVNQAQQTINNYCSISCSQNISNVNITIIGGNATINITQTCSAIGTECAIKNLVSSEITNLISNLVQQSQENAGIFSLLGPSMNNTTNISNAVKNQISQLVNNTCRQDINQNINALNIFAANANGEYNIAQTGTMDHATCVLDTVAKLVLTNNVANDVKQTQTSCGNILGILIIVAIIIVIILLFPIIRSFFGGGGGKVKVSSGGPEKSSKETAAELNRREMIDTKLESTIEKLNENLKGFSSNIGNTLTGVKESLSKLGTKSSVPSVSYGVPIELQDIQNSTMYSNPLAASSRKMGFNPIQSR
jgi:hypothetical protein